jgi:hypothetical protein
MNPRFAMTACILAVESDMPAPPKEAADQIRKEWPELWAMQPKDRAERIGQIMRSHKERTR